MEEPPATSISCSHEERAVVNHFHANHSRTKSDRFIVPLPRKPDVKALGESRSQAVRRFMTLKHSLHHKDRFQEVDAVVPEYLNLGHAEIVPPEHSNKDPAAVFYLPMHVVYKSSSSTTKVRAVFDASASGVSLNNTLLLPRWTMRRILQRQLQDLFTCGGFFLRKWNSSDPRVLQAIFPDMRVQKEIHPISGMEAGHLALSGTLPQTRFTWQTRSSLCQRS